LRGSQPWPIPSFASESMATESRQLPLHYLLTGCHHGLGRRAGMVHSRPGTRSRATVGRTTPVPLATIQSTRESSAPAVSIAVAVYEREFVTKITFTKPRRFSGSLELQRWTEHCFRHSAPSVESKQFEFDSVLAHVKCLAALQIRFQFS
jgi:hypothetical protein